MTVLAARGIRKAYGGREGVAGLALEDVLPGLTGREVRE